MVLLAILDSPKDALSITEIADALGLFAANGFYVSYCFGRKWPGTAANMTMLFQERVTILSSLLKARHISKKSF